MAVVRLDQLRKVYPNGNVGVVAAGVLLGLKRPHLYDAANAVRIGV